MTFVTFVKQIEMNLNFSNFETKNLFFKTVRKLLSYMYIFIRTYFNKNLTGRKLIVLQMVRTLSRNLDPPG